MLKSGQAAMEFLMTYGWAILVVLVVIGALSYFGVLSPATLLPEKCTFPVSVSCTDHSVGADYIALVLQNGAGRDMLIRGVSATSDALTDGGCTTDEGEVDGVLLDDTCPVSAGIGTNGCTGGSILANGQRMTITMKAKSVDGTANCAFTQTGRDKNRYNIEIFYSWRDSTTIMHSLPGELLARS